MKTLLITVLMFLTPLKKNCEDLKTVRGYFLKEVTKVQLLHMIKICEQSKCNLTVPYHAAATMKRAEFEWSPIKKLKSFRMGKEMLDSFIKKYPENIEARYIRWLTQKKVPSFLNYSKNLDEDYNYIITHIEKSSIDSDYKKTIVQNLKKIKNE